MSCYHRHLPHGCGEPAEWYDDYGYRPRRYRDEVVVVRDDDDYFDEDRPRRRRGRRRREETNAGPVTPASLASRAETLRAELSRIEEDLAALTAKADPEA